MSDEQPKQLVLQTAPFDARFPNQNQTKRCYQAYTDYFKCVAAKGEEFTPCNQFSRVYHAICPVDWVCPPSCPRAHPHADSSPHRSTSGTSSARRAPFPATLTPELSGAPLCQTRRPVAVCPPPEAQRAATHW